MKGHQVLAVAWKQKMLPFLEGARARQILEPILGNMKFHYRRIRCTHILCTDPSNVDGTDGQVEFISVWVLAAKSPFQWCQWCQQCPCLPQLLLAQCCPPFASSAERLPCLCQSHHIPSVLLEMLFILLGHTATRDGGAAWHKSAVM